MVTAEAPAAPPSATADGLDSLRQRAAEFWAARVATNAQTQWDLLEPRGRGRMTVSEYAPIRGPLKYIAYQVEDATVNGSFAVVNVRLIVLAAQFVQRGIGPQVVKVPDRWVKIEGTWYRSLEQAGDPGVATGQR
jgi:hypothetical protein